MHVTEPVKPSLKPMIAAENAPGVTTLVIGCGNPLRGDDAVGIEVVRRLAARGLPRHVRCLDAGSSGLDVVLAMRQMDEVLLVDASAPSDTARSRPGRLSEHAIDDLPGITAGVAATTGISIHAVRWDQAIALAGLLGGSQPARLTCFLVEGCCFGFGEPLSPAVKATADRLVELLVRRLHEERPTGSHPEVPGGYPHPRSGRPA
jgi:hydrogenase maturation protease